MSWLAITGKRGDVKNIRSFGVFFVYLLQYGNGCLIITSFIWFSYLYFTFPPRCFFVVVVVVFVCFNVDAQAFMFYSFLPLFPSH